MYRVDNTAYKEKYETLRKEFEEYAYAVSHDFKAPLRHINESSQILVERLAKKIGPEEQKLVSIIQDSFFRSEAMLKALTDLSRINTRGEEFTEVNTQALVESVKQGFLLSGGVENVSIDVVDNMPVVQGDEQQLRTLWHHLIDNAIKFRSSDREVRICINARRQDGDWYFSIEDNGLGIEKGEEGEVFRLFFQGRPKDAYPGIGVGLAMCRRIVARHHGIIWCNGTLRGMTSFTFTMPAASRRARRMEVL